MLRRILFCLGVLGFAALAFAAEPERSVIQILASSQVPDWDAPWRFESLRRAGGSGFIIKGKRIMTNAHVVNWARQIIVRRYQDPRPYLAEVEFVGHDCDLAVLSVADPKFFEGLEPLDVGELPNVRSAVITYGYPAGGEEISYTRGVVSRIELQTYSHIGNRQLLTAQTDAAINPGNSGGPVIQDDKVVGVAFQGMPGLENAGFFIPPPVIEHFLKDIEDKKYDGFPQAGLRVVALQNQAYRKYLKLPDDNLGARVDGIIGVATTKAVVKEDDVLLRAGGFPVASDGTILFQGNRLSVAFAFQQAQHGSSVPLELWRGGCKTNLSLPVYYYSEDHAAGYQYDVLPKYFVYGGLVFTPLSLDYVRTFGRDNAEPSQSDLYYELFYRRYETPEKVRPEPVVLAAVLADAANANVGLRGKALIDSVNGTKVNSMADLVRAFETNTNAYDVIQFVRNQAFETLDRAEVAKANSGIMKNYSIPNDRRL